jgi:hypothetical protein
MWMVTKDEAVEMYARYFAARHRSAASRRARDAASSLHLNGDLDGYKVWNDVADTIERPQAERRRRA